MAKTLSAQLETEVISVPADTPLIDAVRRMKRESIGALLVRNLEGGFIGIFTERDLVLKIDNIRAHDGWLKPIGLVLTKPLLTLPIKQFDKAAETMLTNGIRHLPLTSGKEVVAIISMRDLFRHVVETGRLSVLTPIADKDGGKAIALVGATPGFARTLEAIAGLKEIEGSILAVKNYSAAEFSKLKLERAVESVVMVDLDFVDVTALKDVLNRVRVCSRNISVVVIYSSLHHSLAEEKALKRLASSGGIKCLTKPVVVAELIKALKTTD